MDRYKRKRVRTMKKVLRNHGAPVPKSGCGLKVLLLVAVSSLMLTSLGPLLLF